jgi:hypothetical protein
MSMTTQFPHSLKTGSECPGRAWIPQPADLGNRHKAKSGFAGGIEAPEPAQKPPTDSTLTRQRYNFGTEGHR